MRNINKAGIDLIKQYEGCRLKAYKDAVGVWTVGFGHTSPDVVEGIEIDLGTANELLENDLRFFQEGVEDLITADLNENQFSALVCFAYNLGLAALKRSHLLDYVNAGKFNEASNEFHKWNKGNGVELSGLTKRRMAEKNLFLA